MDIHEDDHDDDYTGESRNGVPYEIVREPDTTPTLWAVAATIGRTIFVVLALWAFLAMMAMIARADQDITVKPGRLKRIESKLDSKKLVWRPVGDFDLIEDSSGKYATTLFPTPGVYTLFVFGAKADEPLVELIKITVEGVVPPPPLPPDPPPGPGPVPPPPGPLPIPGDGLRVLMVYETADAAKPGHVPLFSKTIRDYLDSKCAKGPDNRTPEYRIYDKDTDVSRDAKTWQDALKRPRTQLPWVIISNGRTGFEGPLPPDIVGVVELFKKFGG